MPRTDTVQLMNIDVMYLKLHYDTVLGVCSDLWIGPEYPSGYKLIVVLFTLGMPPLAAINKSLISPMLKYDSLCGLGVSCLHVQFGKVRLLEVPSPT